MTTQLETVYYWMTCQHKIKVKPLSEGETWTLFMENLGRDIALSPEVEGIAKVVARECAGLPLFLKDVLKYYNLSLVKDMLRYYNLIFGCN